MNYKFKYILIFSFSIFIFTSLVADTRASENLFNVDANTIALWRFNETTGSTVADETGINNGTAVGTTIVDGKFGKARYFNGINNYITIPHSLSLTNFSQLTLEAWIYPTGFDLGCWNQNESIIFKGVETPPAIIDYALRIDRNVDYSCGAASSFRQVKFSSQFGGVGVASQLWHEPNQWYYVVSTYDGNYFRVYVNGILEAVSDYAPNITGSTTYPLYINHHTWNYEYSSSQRVQGLIDEIRISNIARLAEEIVYYYNLAISPPNQPPTVSNLGQYKSNGLTAISEEGITTESTVVFKANSNDPDNDQVKLQIELKEFNQPFDGQNLLESDFINLGSETVINRQSFDGQYHWRARAVDDKGNASDWQEFGTVGNVDFIVNLPLSYKAANLAKELINQPYLWGGKGWDYNQNSFVSADTVKTGYNFYNASIKSVDFGTGVDCSGLVMWSYNRSFDLTKSRFNNFVKAEGADEQFRENTEPTTEVQLKPGDVMFFDWGKWDANTGTWDGIKDDYIDHVVMYVGESGGYDVVSATSRDKGIEAKLKDGLKSLSGFVAFKYVASALSPAVLATSYSPVDLILTDPDGFTITPTTTIPSDLEFLRQIPGVLYYSEIERGTDGKPIDQVYSYTFKTGDYIIRVLSEPVIPSDITYSLDFSAGEQSIILAQDTPISQIPSDGYGITTSDTGTLNTFIPVSIDIKPGSYPNSINLNSKGTTPVAIFGSATFGVRQIDLNTIKLAETAIKLKNNGQPMINYEDINGDSFIDIVAHVITKNLQLTLSDTKANLEGKLFDGTIIKGSDPVRVIP